jgi:hypothetical protein
MSLYLIAIACVLVMVFAIYTTHKLWKHTLHVDWMIKHRSQVPATAQPTSEKLLFRLMWCLFADVMLLILHTIISLNN